MSTAIDAIFALLSAIALEVPRYGGRLASFAYSIDSLDRIGPECLRSDAAQLARLVAVESDETVERAHLALAWICRDDAYAAAEIAGRFLSGVRRLRLVADAKRNPRPYGFRGYVAEDAILCVSRGRWTKKQWAIVVELAEETRAVDRAADAWADHHAAAYQDAE